MKNQFFNRNFILFDDLLLKNCQTNGKVLEYNIDGHL